MPPVKLYVPLRLTACTHCSPCNSSSPSSQSLLARCAAMRCRTTEPDCCSAVCSTGKHERSDSCCMLPVYMPAASGSMSSAATVPLNRRVINCSTLSSSYCDAESNARAGVRHSCSAPLTTAPSSGKRKRDELMPVGSSTSLCWLLSHTYRRLAATSASTTSSCSRSWRMRASVLSPRRASSERGPRSNRYGQAADGSCVSIQPPARSCASTNRMCGRGTWDGWDSR